MVEHSAVNRVVVGSSPTRGAYGPMVKWLRHRPFTAVTAVRTCLGALDLATWPSGKARVCKTLIPGSIPGVALTPNLMIRSFSFSEQFMK